MNSLYFDRVADYQERLNSLLASTPIRYSEWPPEDSSSIRDSAGVYHFFERRNGLVESIYVGKGGFGNDNGWSLYSRMRQHFQPSQKYALLGKASKAMGRSPEQTKADLEIREIYVQWVALATKNTQPSANTEAELRWFECFCIAVLRPRYTDA